MEHVICRATNHIIKTADLISLVITQSKDGRIFLSPKSKCKIIKEKYIGSKTELTNKVIQALVVVLAQALVAVQVVVRALGLDRLAKQTFHMLLY